MWAIRNSASLFILRSPVGINCRTVAAFTKYSRKLSTDTSGGPDDPSKFIIPPKTENSITKAPCKDVVFSDIKYELDTNYVKGVPTLKDVEPHVYAEQLEKAIRQAPNPSIVLAIVENHHETMVKEHVQVALETIYKYVRDMVPSSRSSFLSHLVKNLNFQLLCLLAAKNAPFYSTNDILQIITALGCLQFDSNHTVFQVFLELAKHSINDFKAHQLVHLGFVLGKITNNKAVKILHKLSAKALMNILDKEIHLLDIRQLTNLLWIYGPDFSTKNIEKVMEAILNQRESNKFTKPVMLLNILRKNAIRDEIVTRVCLKKIRFQLKKGFLTLSDIQAVLEACRELQIYNFDTFHTIDTYLYNTDISLPTFIQLLDSLVQCNFAPILSVPKYVDILKDNGCMSELLKSSNLEQIKMILSPLGMMNIRDKKLSSSIQSHFCSMSPDFYLNDSTNKGLLLETSLYLLMIGCQVPWLSGLLDQLQAYISEDLQSADIWEEEKQDLIHKSSILLLLVKHGAVLKQSIGDLTWLKQALDYYSRWDILQKPLEVLYGGGNYVKNSVFHQGVLLDHVVMFDDHMQPVHIEISNVQPKPEQAFDVLDLMQHSSSDITRVGVCVLDKRHFLENTGQLLGPYAQMVDTLQNNGIHSLMVNRHSWRRVPEKEKLEYLKYKMLVAAREGHSVLFSL